MSRPEVEALIPHRPPFLFVDAITDRGEDWLEAQWSVPADAEFFRGHYPDHPVTPGVILSEHSFQCAALLISSALGGFAAEDGVPVLTRIEKARFKRVVLPGELLETRVEVTERLGPAWYMRARIARDGSTVATLTFVLSATDAMRRVGGDG